jgi:16S rRNA G966 N2-methylase RsmD
MVKAVETTGWRPSCKCLDEWGVVDAVPCTLLDPFAGTGTVGLVAQRFSRRAVLIDLNPDYLRQCLERTAQSPLGLEVGA